MKELQKKAIEFQKLNCQIVLVSFGDAKGAHRWLKENHLPFSNNHFDMITDETRVLYKLFGLKNSYSKVWNKETLIYYAEQLLRIGQLPKAYQDVEDDPHQMGGNFLIEFTGDSSFKLVYDYKSKNPPDRPSAEALLKFLAN